MLDLKETEPKLELFYPLVLHYSVNAAILFSYLLLLAEKQYGVDLSNEDLKHDKSFIIKVDDFDLCEALNMTRGQFIDASRDLIGADLGDGPHDKDRYYIWPGHRKKLRAFVYRMRNNWNFNN